LNSLIYLLRALPALTATATLLASTSASCEGSYKPPFLPIAVSINDQGELSASFDTAIVTPIGTFALNVKPPLPKNKADGLLEILHQRHKKPVGSFFLVHGFNKGKTEIAVTGGSGVHKSGNRKKTTIEVPPGAQKFTLDVENHDAVQPPSTKNATTWTEPTPTTTQPTTTEPTSTEPTTTDSFTTIPTTTTTTRSTKPTKTTTTTPTEEVTTTSSRTTSRPPTSPTEVVSTTSR
jgi:hypothetical protein